MIASNLNHDINHVCHPSASYISEFSSSVCSVLPLENWWSIINDDRNFFTLISFIRELRKSDIYLFSSTASVLLSWWNVDLKREEWKSLLPASTLSALVSHHLENRLERAKASSVASSSSSWVWFRSNLISTPKLGQVTLTLTSKINILNGWETYELREHKIVNHDDMVTEGVHASV